MKKMKKRNYKNKGVIFTLLRILVLIIAGVLYFIYFIIREFHTLIGKGFMNLPRITKIATIYSLIFCAGFGLWASYTINPRINFEIKRISSNIDIPNIDFDNSQIAYAKTKPKPKPKPKVVDKPKIETPVKPITASVGDYQNYAHDLVINAYGWSEYDFECLVKLWNRESSWRANAHNPSSGAHGIPQSLPASKMASEGADYYTNGYTQIRWGLKYIAGRYGTPSNAWAHSESHGWY